MVNEKVINFRIEPYIQEITVLMIWDVLVTFILFTMFLIWKTSLFLIVSIMIAYIGWALFFHYRVVIQATIDKKKGDYVTEVVSTKKVGNEFTLATDHWGYSLFYPKKMHVCKHKIEIINDQGEKKKLRSVMSFVRSIQFVTFDYKPRIERFQVTYLRRSKILLHVALIEEECKHIRPKERRKIDKTIHSINTSI